MTWRKRPGWSKRGRRRILATNGGGRLHLAIGCPAVMRIHETRPGRAVVGPRRVQRQGGSTPRPPCSRLVVSFRGTDVPLAVEVSRGDRIVSVRRWGLMWLCAGLAAVGASGCGGESEETGIAGGARRDCDVRVERDAAPEGDATVAGGSGSDEAPASPGQPRAGNGEPPQAILVRCVGRGGVDLTHRQLLVLLDPDGLAVAQAQGGRLHLPTDADASGGTLLVFVPGYESARFEVRRVTSGSLSATLRPIPDRAQLAVAGSARSQVLTTIGYVLRASSGRILARWGCVEEATRSPEDGAPLPEAGCVRPRRASEPADSLAVSGSASRWFAH